MSENVEFVWAFVDDGVVSNTVVINDLKVVEELKKQHNEVIQVNDGLVAGVGYTYTKKEGFRPPKPYDSWVWDSEGFWSAPVPKPPRSDGNNPEPWDWSEEKLEWFVPQWWLDEQAGQDQTEEVG